jgi:hypothetical protein
LGTAGANNTMSVVGTARNVTIGSNIIGGGVTKTGNGTRTLSGTNT